jgi:hypothetical protein
MALVVYCPKALLDSIYKAIDKGDVKSWAYDQDRDFSCTDKEWNNEAWLRPRVAGDSLKLGLVGQKGVKMSKVLYAVYHGRFAEMAFGAFRH